MKLISETVLLKPGYRDKLKYIAKVLTKQTGEGYNKCSVMRLAIEEFVDEKLNSNGKGIEWQPRPKAKRNS